nr:hypothetical protein [uncultured Rhodopila sp.]
MLIFCTLVGLFVLWVVCRGAHEAWRELEVDRAFEREIRDRQRLMDDMRRGTP